MKYGRLVLLATLLAAPWAVSVTGTEPPSGDSLYQYEAQLTDQQGRPLAWRDLRGGPRLVSMFYTHCHVMCPLILESAKAVQKQLSTEERQQLELIMISLDPARDTPAALAETARVHQLDKEHWHLLQPEAQDVRALASLLDVRYRAQDDGTFNHTSVLILLDADGRIVGRSEVTGIAPDPAFVALVRRLLARRP